MVRPFDIDETYLNVDGPMLEMFRQDRRKPIQKKAAKFWYIGDLYKRAIAEREKHCAEMSDAPFFVSAITCWYKNSRIRAWEFHYHSSDNLQFSFLVHNPDANGREYPCHHGQARNLAHLSIIWPGETLMPNSITWRFNKTRCYEVE